MKFKLSLAIVLLLAVFFVAGSALAMTEQERQILIAQIQAQIAQLTQQLNQMLAEQQNDATWCHTFNFNIKYGATGAEVSALHTVLQKQGLYISTEEQSSQYFGDYTTIAVNSFQERYASEILWPLGLTHGTSFVGASTRAKLNQFYECTANTTCTPYWYCGSWSACANNQQTRTCSDTNYCGTTTGAPSQTQSCTSASIECTTAKDCQDIYKNCYYTCSDNECVSINTLIALKPYPECLSIAVACNPSWSCGSWGVCTNGQQTKTCTDSNNCGTITNRPATTQSCGSNISNNTCTDTDGSQQSSGNVSSTMPGVTYTQWGNDYYIKGTTAGVYNSWNNSNPKSGQYGSYTDYCNGNKLIEYYCYTTNSSTDQVVATFTDASLAGYQNGGAPASAYYSTECKLGCQDGACKKGIYVYDVAGVSNTPSWLEMGKTVRISWSLDGISVNTVDIFLTNYDNNQKTTIATGVSAKDGSSAEGVYNWSVPSTVINGSKYKISVVSGATKGETNYFSIIVSNKCVDSDGGHDFYKKGTVTITNVNGTQSSGSYTDRCTGGNYIMEYDCQGTSEPSPNIIEFSCPKGCSNGVCNPCTPIWQCGDWFATCINGLQYRFCYDKNNCGATTGKPVETQPCPPTPTVCTSFTYSDWSTCNQSGTQGRTVTSSYPSGCAGGSPITSQACVPELLPSITSFTIKDVNGTGATTWPYISPMYSLTVPYNTAATISWSSKNTTSCVAAGDWSGTKAISGIESTGNIVLLTTDEIKNGIVKRLYTLICADSITDKTVKSSIIQIVSVQPNIYLRANSTPTKITVPYNTPVTLTWGAGPTRLTNGQLISPASCLLGVKGYGGPSVSLSGSKSIGNVTSNTTYTLGCLYPNDWPDAPNCNAGERCCARQSSTSMDVGNGAGITVEGDNISNCLESVNPSNGQYTVGKSIDINIIIAPPTVDIKANNSDTLVVPYNSTADITWTATGGVTSCTASGSWSGIKASSGSEKTGTLNASPSWIKTYTITCTGSGGTATDSVTISVNNP